MEFTQCTALLPSVLLCFEGRMRASSGSLPHVGAGWGGGNVTNPPHPSPPPSRGRERVSGSACRNAGELHAGWWLAPPQLYSTPRDSPCGSTCPGFVWMYNNGRHGIRRQAWRFRSSPASFWTSRNNVRLDSLPPCGGGLGWGEMLPITQGAIMAEFNLVLSEREKQYLEGML